MFLKYYFSAILPVMTAVARLNVAVLKCLTKTIEEGQTVPESFSLSR